MANPEISLATAEEMPDINGWLRQHLRAFNAEFLGQSASTPIMAVAKVNDEVVGGFGGVVILDWLSVDIVFIAEEYRGNGMGTRMLLALEEEGRRLGATRAFVDTTSFQAEGFYAKFGYVEWGRFRDFAPGVDRIYMRKDKL